MDSKILSYRKVRLVKVRMDGRQNKVKSLSLTDLHVVTNAFEVFIQVRNGDGDGFGELRKGGDQHHGW